jgi:hypothetical protein
MKYYIIYKITNLINGRYYIGKHITDNINDSYMGSGKLIKKAIEKYGIESFRKDIISVYDNEHDMNIAESAIINLNDKMIYNLHPGGKGGWQYVNSNELNNNEESIQIKSIKMKEYWTEEKRKEKSENMKKFNEEHGTERYTKVLKERYSDPTFLETFKDTMTEVNRREEKRKDASEKLKELWKNEDYKKKMKKRKRGSNSNALKAKWKDPEWKKMMLEKRKKT